MSRLCLAFLIRKQRQHKIESLVQFLLQYWIMVSLEITPKRFIGSQHPVFVIAEIGQNHQGSLDEAKKLIDAAGLAGVDCVKLQKTSLKDKFTEHALKRPYSSKHSWGETYGQHKQYLEFSDDEFKILKLYAEKQNLLFTASAKDCKSLKFLRELDVPFIKIGSGDADDHFLLHEAAKCEKPLIISTGMQDIDDVRQVYKTVKEQHNRFAILHCISSYPTDYPDVNLRVIRTFQNEFPDIPIGYSGHELGIAVPVAAVALGATIIEKHITLDKSQKGSDHQCSLTPQEFQVMVRDIRAIEQALGDGKKTFTPNEMHCYNKLGKSIVAAKDLAAGINIEETDLKIKVSHPNGIPAKKLKRLIGAKLRRNINCDEPLLSEDIDGLDK